MSKHLRILSINGGGVKGIVPAAILDSISQNTGKQIPELFDFIIGTSIGGILAAAYATPNNTVSDSREYVKFDSGQVLDILKDNAKSIFPPDKARSFPASLFYSKYPRESLDVLLEESFNVDGANLRLIDTLVPVAVTSQNTVSDEPQIWWSCSKTFSTYFLKDVTGATSAAPTFFPPKFIRVQNQTQARAANCAEFNLVSYREECEYKAVDGGLFANSPAILSLFLLNQAMLGKTAAECSKYDVFQPGSLQENLTLQFASVNPQAAPKLFLGDDLDITVVSVGTGHFVAANSEYNGLSALEHTLLAFTTLSLMGLSASITPFSRYIDSPKDKIEISYMLFSVLNAPITIGLGFHIWDKIRNMDSELDQLSHAKNMALSIGILSVISLPFVKIPGAVYSYSGSGDHKLGVLVSFNVFDSVVGGLGFYTWGMLNNQEVSSYYQEKVYGITSEALAVGILSSCFSGLGFVASYDNLWRDDVDLVSQGVGRKNIFYMFLSAALVGIFFSAVVGAQDSDEGGIYHAFGIVESILTSNEHQDSAITRDIFGTITINPIFSNTEAVPLDSSNDASLNLLERNAKEFVRNSQVAFNNLSNCLLNNETRVSECDYAAMYFYDNFRDDATPGIISGALEDNEL